MINYTTATNGKTTKTLNNPTSTRSRFNILKFLSAFALVMLLGVTGVMGQTTIYSTNFGTTAVTSSSTFVAGWTSPNYQTGGTAPTNMSISTSSASSTYSTPITASGGANLADGSTSPSSGTATATLAGQVNTTGYTSIQLAFGYRASSTSYTATVTLDWSPDGSTWNSVSLGTLTRDGSWRAINGSNWLSLPSGAENQSNLRFRFTFVRANTSGNFRIDDFTVRGTATPSIAISNGTISAGSPNNGQTNVVLQRYDMAVTTADATLTGLTVTTAGTYAAADLSNLKCWYQTSTTFNSGTATLLSTKSTSLGSGSQVFPTFSSQSLVSGSTYYIFVTANIASGATNGNTINIASTAFSNITFSSGTKTGTDPVAAGGLQTITVAVPDIALSSPAASSANITVGTSNNVIYRFDLAITTATPSLTGVTINTSTGINVAADLTNLKCWYQTTTTFNAGTATLLSTKTSSLDAGSQVFPTFSSQSLTTGSTYYIFITADVPLTATPNNTIIVSAITTSDLTFATGNKTGTANASGTKTLIDCTPADVTSAAASSASVSSVLTWVNPACYDEILIVAALASNSGTPSGNGSAYTSNLAYGSGTALGNGFVVYKGSTSSQTVTGLTNGTQYFYKFFTRRGTTWTSGTEVDATPNISGYYWNGGSIAANPAAGGTGIWGTANSWRQPSATGAQATWADNNNAIFAGTAGSVTIDATRVATAFYFNTTGYELINTTTQTLTGPIVLANNVGLTFSPNVNIAIPAGGTVNIGSVSGSGTANITINSAQGSATNVAQRINLASASSSISVPINIVSAGGTGTGTVAGIVATNLSTSLSSAATITNNTAIKTAIGATSGDDITVNSVISGSADLIFAAGASGGAGTITLNAANNYAGATIFNAANSGVVKLGVNDALPTTTNVTFGYSTSNGGSLDLNGKNQTLASIINGGFGSSANRIVNNGNTDATLTINGSTSPTAFVFGIQDGTTNKILLVKAGSGTLILDGTTTSGGNTYTGLTTVSGGTLRLNRSGGTTIPVGNSVTVSGGTLQVSTNQTLNNLTLTSGTVIIDAGVTLTINGTITRTSGVIQGTATSNLVITGASGTIAFDQTTPGTTNVLKNLTISGSGTTTLGNALNITGGSSFGVLTVGSGATLTTGGNLTLKSDANGTACIGNSAGSVSGNVTVERYVSSSGRRWRFLSSPVQSKTIADWISQFAITGPGTTTSSTIGGFNSSGWHQTYNNITNSTAAPYTSVRLYVEANSTTLDLNLGWGDVSTSTSLTAGQGFRTFIRGPISGIATQLGVNGNATTQAEVTLSLSGTINSGDIAAPSLTYNQTGWNLLGNPYPCAFNFNSMYDENIGTEIANINPNVYAYNSIAGTPGYVSYNALSNTSGGLTGGIIPSGAGFFILATGTPTFVFKETYKTTTAPIALQKNDISNVEFGIKYSKDTLQGDYMVVKMFDGATLNSELYDIKKLKNEDYINLSSYGKDNIDLTASCIPFISEETRIKLNVEAVQVGTYKFDFTNMDNFDAGVSVSLLDKYTNTTTDVKKNTKYTFELGAGVNQWGKNRFEIILNGKATTGVNENTTNVTAAQLSVYPNPATDVLNISLSNGTSIETVNIYNVTGKLVNNTKLNGNQIDISQLNNGVYMVEVLTANGSFKTKFVK